MRKYLSALFVLLLLVGCGSSGEEKIPTPEATPETETDKGTDEDTDKDTDEETDEETDEDTDEETDEAPDEETEPECSVDNSVIFTDCFSSVWAPSLYDSATDDVTYGESATAENASVAIVDLADGTHNQVIDVKMFQATGFSDFAFRSIIESTTDASTIDLSEYENGFFVFDLKVLDYGMNTFGLFSHFQCGWPCRSDYIGLYGIYNAYIPVDTWVTLRLPMSLITADNNSIDDPNLNISLVNAIVITPPDAAGQQTGIHYQLDNIYFEK